MENALLRVAFCLILSIYNVSSEFNCNSETKCMVRTTYSMKSADCYDKDFEEIPKCLPTNIEVLDLTHNRIRDISKTDFERYGSLTLLYLRDNSLSPRIDENSIESLQGLKTLDISYNKLETIPTQIFNLPYLKILYIGENNVNVSKVVEEAKPILSPLTKIDMSYLFKKNDNFYEFPDFGEMPFLIELNITGNRYTDLSVHHFAGLCDLRILSNVNVTAEFREDCDCWDINDWLERRNVSFEKFECNIGKSRCGETEPSEADLKLYNSCRGKLESFQASQRMKKVALGVGISLGILALILAFVAYKVIMNKKRRKMAATQKAAENKRAINEDSIISLLNN